MLKNIRVNKETNLFITNRRSKLSFLNKSLSSTTTKSYCVSKLIRSKFIITNLTIKSSIAISSFRITTTIKSNRSRTTIRSTSNFTNKNLVSIFATKQQRSHLITQILFLIRDCNIRYRYSNSIACTFKLWRSNFNSSTKSYL